MIAFDIAVVAQKVKVQCYFMDDMLNLKKWVVLDQQQVGMAMRAPDGANNQIYLRQWHTNDNFVEK